jgi:ubiquinol-cytochrome c reductase cytochrome c1 subunit
MKKLIVLFLVAVLSLTAQASEEATALQEADIDLSDTESLERGARHFVNYCLGCHALKHMRYIRIATDFGLDNKKVLADIAPLGAGIYDPLSTAMNMHDAEKWFGIMPPDLSLVARSRGADWLYSYLKGFYADPAKPTGVNNTVYQDVAMPHVLWQLQGIQEPVYKKTGGKQIIDRLVLKEPGQLSAEEFDRMVLDLVTFLDYVGEPMKQQRQSMGKYVLFFIFMFFVIAYLLKKEYWKDIH